MPTQEQQRTEGGQPGNANALRTGLRSERLSTEIRVGDTSLPKGFERVERTANAYRRGLEQAVTAAKGEITLSDAHAISTATRAERAYHALHKLLRDDSDLSTMDRAAMLQRAVSLTEKRDAAVRLLNLPIDAQSNWSDLYAQSFPGSDPDSQQLPAIAAGAK